ncbi:hydrogenase maturation nickel metallochaperone HypA [Zoogloea sp.]|uniref:hydrogenase maturation nickel metallochaperone HypA n=1 Tax=Zoogloea sp. TaxID=49181 RepID=UPI002612885E|nr:hydrogenase maturation nickel metallochaperone HypA [Zoogloea sp.]MDD3354755.1 hydrogenase maturation nickel metallochaperone HypA [Zoogloea sp.]
MHEMSLAENIRQIIEEAGCRQGFGRVRTVILEVGALAAVEPESLRFCFDLVMKDSIADGARLQIDSVPGQGQCLQCGKTVPVAALYDPCPCCGCYEVQATLGTGMRVRELEIE